MFDLWIISDLELFIRDHTHYIIIYNLHEEELVKITDILKIKKNSYLVEPIIEYDE